MKLVFLIFNRVFLLFTTFNIKYLWIISICVLSFYSCQKSKDQTPYLVIFSFDGFRWDYQDSCFTPVLDSIALHGVKADALVPAFPTLTFPNHYSIATGLYPGNHGIVHNNFYDKKMRRKYSLGDRESVEDSSFYRGVPLWNHLQSNGIKTATCFWVGSEAPVKGMYANYWKKYDGKLSFKSRMDTVIHWLQMPEPDRPHLVMAYFSEPDHTSHDFGPFAPETKEQVEKLDSLLGYFVSQLKRLPHGKEVNIILLSDHGMAYVDSTQTIVLNDYVKDDWIKAINGGSTCLFVEPEDGFADSVYNESQTIPHIKVFRRDNLPKSWHFDDSTRIDEFVLLADPGYKFRKREHSPRSGGAHGYVHTDPSMKAIFYAIGPKFKQNYHHPEFENIHVFPLAEELFQIEKRNDVDGDIKQVQGMLK